MLWPHLKSLSTTRGCWLPHGWCRCRKFPSWQDAPLDSAACSRSQVSDSGSPLRNLHSCWSTAGPPVSLCPCPASASPGSPADAASLCCPFRHFPARPGSHPHILAISASRTGVLAYRFIFLSAHPFPLSNHLLLVHLLCPLSSPGPRLLTHHFWSSFPPLAFPLSDPPLPPSPLPPLCNRDANCTFNYLIAMAISQLHSIWKVQMANCRHKEVILGTQLCRGELGLSPGG